MELFNFLAGNKLRINFYLAFAIVILGSSAFPVNSVFADHGVTELTVLTSLEFFPATPSFGGIAAMFVDVDASLTSDPAENTILTLEASPGLIYDNVLSSSICSEILPVYLLDL